MQCGTPDWHSGRMKCSDRARVSDDIKKMVAQQGV